MIVLPYAHEKQTVQRLPWVTFALIAINLVVFLLTNYVRPDESRGNDALLQFEKYYYTHPYLEMPPEMKQFFNRQDLDRLAVLKEGTDLTQISADTRRIEQIELQGLAQKVIYYLHQDPFRKYGYVPGDSRWYTLITCQFVHTGWLHLIGNMLFLYLAGCSIEDLWGRPLYIFFYLLSGVVATLVHELKFANSMSPLVGASGAIAGLMGAFLIRMYRTKIHFIYVLFLFLRFKFGTFRAPAYIVLPFWLLLQLYYASLSNESAGVAFWAHIGGFIFGMAFAYAIKLSKLEEKFIAPSIEKKVSLVQNPDFLRAMELSDKEDLSGAMVLLEKVTRQEPNHVDSYMEMRRIAEIQKDSRLYTRYSGAIFDILLRNRDYDTFADLYSQFLTARSRETLPAKTLFGIGNYMEDSSDYNGAAGQYEELVAAYPDEPLTVKALNKLYKLYFDRLSDREQGIQSYWKCCDHRLATDQWRSVLDSDLKRYQIPRPQTALAAGTPLSAATVQPQIAIAHVDPPKEAAIESQPYDEPPRTKPANQNYVILPDSSFGIASAAGSWHLVACSFEKIDLKGIIMRNAGALRGLLPWKKIQTISVGKIRKLDPADPRNNQEFLLIDLVASDFPKPVIYRFSGNTLSFEKIFPGVEQTAAEAFQNFMGIILNNSGARCIPSRDSCTGPSFATFPDEDRYNSRLKEKLLSA